MARIISCANLMWLRCECRENADGEKPLRDTIGWSFVLEAEITFLCNGNKTSILLTERHAEAFMRDNDGSLH
jgi:hypothetical protein